MYKLKKFLRLERSVWLLAAALGMVLFSGGLVAAFVTVLLWKLGASFLDVGYVASLYDASLALSYFLGGSFCGGSVGREFSSLACYVACWHSCVMELQTFCSVGLSWLSGWFLGDWLGGLEIPRHSLLFHPRLERRNGRPLSVWSQRWDMLAP